MASQRVLVIVPCLNEEESLPGLLGRLADARKALEGFEVEVLVVDDGSVDGTASIARKQGARVARLSRNLGIGAAVQTGLRLAAREDFDCAIQMDGDGQHPPDQLPVLLSGSHETDAADLLIGSRFLSQEGWQSTVLRRAGIRWLSFLLRTVVGVRVADPTSGFRLYGRRALALFERNYPYDYPEPESIALAHAAGLRVRETPIQMQERQGGSSSIRGLKTAHYMVKVTLAVLLTFVRSRAPGGTDLRLDH